mgnify:CR=1 FL=1
MNDAATGAEIVRFSHVSKHYSGTLANDDVSLTSAVARCSRWWGRTARANPR